LQADKERLIRRVTFDLTGLPPTLDEIDAFLADESPNAYGKIVDRLMASPRYGERWAVPWLDAARYSDSNGYQRDGRRVYWAYRDWVVKALNADMPFDQFTIEQIAGDLLPNATLEQKIATGFHRGTMANVEAGTDPEEERNIAIVDRVNTTGTVWLGTTVSCAQCHNHKYDPFTQKEYYQLFAFFNNTEAEITTRGSGRDFVGPKIPLPLEAKQQRLRKELQAKIAKLKKSVQAHTKSLKSEQPKWEKQVADSMSDGGYQVLVPLAFKSAEVGGLRIKEDHSLLAGGNFPSTDLYVVETAAPEKPITAFRLEIMTDASLPGGGPGRVKPGNFILSEFQVEIATEKSGGKFEPVKLKSAFADFSQNKWPVENSIDGNRKTGWAIAPQFGSPHYAVFIPEKPLELGPNSKLKFSLDQQYGNSRTIGRFQLLATSGDAKAMDVPSNIRKLAAITLKKRDKKQAKQLADFFLSQSAELTSLKKQLKTTESQFKQTAPITTLVMKELDKPRMTHRLLRGDFLSPAEEVQPGTPAVLHDMPADKSPNRLTLAKWLVDFDNPLVARVTVNRHWAEFFGSGIVATLEEFGNKGERPTHPQLLDFLATEFMDGGWSMKAIHRLIVTSATYQQSSYVTPELLEQDPYNKFYARGPRFRLPAEIIRDNALAVSGLLSQKMHGPPVFPVQPTGVWNHIGQASNAWTTSTGDNLYRRGMYVNWRRTVPYPSFVNFDAPSREFCSVQRSRSNTPLQALTLMNDPVYFEAAAALANRLMTETKPNGPSAKKSDPAANRVRLGFRLSTGRTPSRAEVDILVRRYRQELKFYQKYPKQAQELSAAWPATKNMNLAEFAAWLSVSNVLLNLDEVITKG